MSGVELERIDFQQNVDLCVLARTSDYTIVNIENNQCTRMPHDFNSVMKKYNRRPNSVFKVFEMDKKHLGRNLIMHSTSEAKNNLKISNFMLCTLIFTTVINWIVI